MTKMIVLVKSSGVRAVAFSEEKMGSIRRDLLREGRKRAFTLGMRKTSVEELTDAVGIAKGSFYKFFPSKELLFFAVLEDIHTEIYAVAESALRESAALPPAERAAAAILAASRRLSEKGAMAFVENDAEYLLRRLPAEVKAAHYHDDEVHIRALLEGSGLCPREGMALAAATVRGLILMVSHQGQIGPLYPRVLEMLVRGACRELFPAE
ncbi:MAG: TetR/AcrR family transcriptional regulator [Clostridia bacterium]|nr:TetR/AcrR family transcriptional regulator [Clostridia bacterium]